MVPIENLVVGDQIRLVDHFDPDFDRSDCTGIMDKYLGRIVTVLRVELYDDGWDSYVKIEEDQEDQDMPGGWCWFAEMIEELIDAPLQPSDTPLKDLYS